MCLPRLCQHRANKTPDTHHHSYITVGLFALFFVLKGACSEEGLSLSTLKGQVVSSSVIALQIIYIPVTRATLNVFMCTPVGDGSFVYYDIDKACFGPEHQLIALLVALPSLIVFVVGFPCGLCYHLNKQNLPDRITRWANKTQNEEDEMIFQRFSYVVKGYKPHFWFWELVIMIRKVYNVTAATTTALQPPPL